MTAPRLAQLLAAAALGVAGACLARAPEFPAPPEARVNTVGQDMVLNGIPMQVRRFATEDGVEDVVDFYRREWGDGTKDKPGFIVNTTMPPWFIVTRMEDEYLLTVQVQHDGRDGAWGYLALGRLSEKQRGPVLGKHFPMPGGSQTMHELITEDPGKRGRTMQIASGLPLPNTVMFYRDYYGEKGWTFDIDRAVGSRQHVLTARNGRQLVNLVITQTDLGPPIVVVNEVTNELL